MLRPVKCPMCQEIRQEEFLHEPKIMYRIYCERCLEKMRNEDKEAEDAE